MRPLLARTLPFAAAFAPACALVPRHADAPAFRIRGPIPARTQQPIKLTYLSFRPRRAAIQPDGETQFTVQGAYSSLYQNGHADGDDVVLDGEILRTSVGVRRGVGPATDLEVEFAATYADAGFLDHFIEEYHQLLGFPDEGRGDRPQDAYEMDVRKNGVQAYRLEEGEPGIGDLPIVLTQSLRAETSESPGVSCRAGIELPTGSESRGFGNGELDYGVGLLAEKSLGRWTTTAAADYVVTGTSRSFRRAGISADNDLDLQLGLEYRWNDRLSLLLGAELESPVTRDITIKELDGDILSLDLGAAWDVGRRSRLLLDFGEDVIAKSGPDLTFLVVWSWSP